VPTLLLVAALLFLLLRVIPGDPALLILTGGTGEGQYTASDLAALRAKLGTDQPLHSQFARWLWDVARGDLGTAMFYGTSIRSEIADRLPVTLELAALSAILSWSIAIPLGALSALRRDTALDYLTRVIVFLGVSVPIFVTGILVVYLLVRLFNWFPPLGHVSLWADPGRNLQQMVFPALALAFFELNFTARIARSAFLEVLGEDYVRTARAKGLRQRRITYVHALRNALLPIVTVMGWSLGRLLGGSIIIERIFVVPGMGSLLLDGVVRRDYTLVQGIVLVFTTVVLMANLAVDLLYGWLDPRIRYA